MDIFCKKIVFFMMAIGISSPVHSGDFIIPKNCQATNAKYQKCQRPLQVGAASQAEAPDQGRFNPRLSQVIISVGRAPAAIAATSLSANRDDILNSVSAAFQSNEMNEVISENSDIDVILDSINPHDRRMVIELNPKNLKGAKFSDAINRVIQNLKAEGLNAFYNLPVYNNMHQRKQLSPFKKEKK